ncbi:hypothetical protein [Kribbella solani]|uniref:Uncharacterized protein n=1 Tax=Kribbella solani TaxID=236067 RepID=A0A841DGR1_9ACTN|nr:hypothetical protein [Kribbella solani]MBB5977713.1 hypothetical protein [Kribbella solani]
MVESEVAEGWALAAADVPLAVVVAEESVLAATECPLVVVTAGELVLAANDYPLVAAVALVADVAVAAVAVARWRGGWGVGGVRPS